MFPANESRTVVDRIAGVSIKCYMSVPLTGSTYSAALRPDMKSDRHRSHPSTEQELHILSDYINSGQVVWLSVVI